MNAIANITQDYVEVTVPDWRTGKVHIERTGWGYILSRRDGWRKLAVGAELVAAFTGMTLMASALATAVLAAIALQVALLPLQLAVAVVFAATGWILWNYARRGLLFEAQIDTSRSELRTVLRNRRGQAWLMERLAFKDVGSAFLHRAATPMAPSRLYVRYRDSHKVVEIAEGREEELMRLHKMLCREIHPRQRGRRNVPLRSLLAG